MRVAVLSEHWMRFVVELFDESDLPAGVLLVNSIAVASDLTAGLRHQGWKIEDGGRCETLESWALMPLMQRATVRAGVADPPQRLVECLQGCKQRMQRASSW